MINKSHINKNKIKPKTKKLANAIIFDNIDYDDLIKLINQRAPIKINTKFLDKIYKKYPFIKKDEISLIMKTTFEVIREHMTMGYKINIRCLFGEAHLNVGISNGKPRIRVKHSTIPTIRKKIL